jgi:hypothetical protein
MLLARHPLRHVKSELQGRVLTELPLDSGGGNAHYLDLAFWHAFSEILPS